MKASVRSGGSRSRNTPASASPSRPRAPAHDVVVATVRFEETTRTIIDGRTDGFCKLIVDRGTHQVVGCSVVGDRAVEIVQVVAIAMSSRSRVEDLARISLSFPTYTGVLGRVAYRACERLGVDTNTWNQPGDAYGP